MVPLGLEIQKPRLPLYASRCRPSSRYDRSGKHLYEHAYRIAYDIDLEGLNRFFGFGSEEFFLSAAIVAVPDRGEEVSKSGAFSTFYLSQRGVGRDDSAPPIDSGVFAKRPITKAQFKAIMEIVDQPIPSDCDEPLQIYAVINRVEGMPLGVWHRGEMVKIGDFCKEAGYLCLKQRLGSESAVTFFILSDGYNYRALYQKAGIVGHRLYLASGYLGIGCSGIGAYYDDDVAAFLQSDAMVLYALAIGR